MNSRYFFLYLKTGGGHLAPARSVTTFLKTRYADLEPTLVDGLEEAPRAIRYCLEDGYKHLQSYARWLYAVLYFINKWNFAARCNAWLVGFFVRPYLERRILAESPSKIVIFHFFLIKPIRDILTRHNLSIPTLVVVTDPFTAHPLWFLDQSQRFIVFSNQLRKHCLNHGIPAANVNLFPFVLDEKFAEVQPSTRSQEHWKLELGFSPQRKLILVIGGADGMPRGGRLIKHLMEKNPLAQIAVVCGRNASLMKKLTAIHSPSNALTIFGFVDFVHDLLKAADVVVTKCGASTCMETLVAGKIPLVSNYLWEQEKGNVDFIQEYQLGVYERNVKKLSEWVDRLFTDNPLYESFQKNIERTRLVNGVGLVSEYIVRFDAV